MPFQTFNYDIDTKTEACDDCPRTSYIRRMELMVIDCGSMLHNDLCDLWNNTRCGNDVCYCNPFIPGDKIYLQFPLPIKVVGNHGNPQTTSAWNTDYFAALIDEDGEIIPEFNTIETFTSEFGIGVDLAGKGYVWMVIDTNKLGTVCDFNVTIADGQLNGDPEGKPITNQFYTESYCCVKCNEPTLLVRGTYKKYDPFGGFYGNFNAGAFTGNQNGYQAQIRVYGTLERLQNQIENTYVETQKTKVKINPVYLLRTLGLPLYVADQLTVALGGQEIFIDGLEYASPDSIDKNNPEGQMWYVESQLILVTDETRFECDE